MIFNFYRHARLIWRKINGKIEAFLQDKGSTNGTKINGEKLKQRRYFYSII